MGECCGQLDPCPRPENSEYEGFHIDLMRESLMMATGDPRENESLQLVKDWWRRFLVMWPEDSVGKYHIRRFDHPTGDYLDGSKWTGWSTRSQITGRMVPPVPDGLNYTGLFEVVPDDDDQGKRYNVLPDQKSVMWMSDTPSEVLDHMEVVDRAYGHVLITGLGLGILPKALLDVPCVEHITIIERTPEIIELIGPLLYDLNPGKITILHGDAYKYSFPANTHFDIIWHDIWPTISDANLAGMRELRKRYAKFNPSWQGCWREENCKEMQDRYQRFARAKRRGDHALAQRLAFQYLNEMEG